ncbi:hypothetical protein AMELA_G00070430, partial [Ameiurus melas]
MILNNLKDTHTDTWRTCKTRFREDPKHMFKPGILELNIRRNRSRVAMDWNRVSKVYPTFCLMLPGIGSRFPCDPEEGVSGRRWMD